MTDLIAAAREWIEGDPDPVSRAELSDVLESGDETTLQSVLGGSLSFGTAGIRGEVGPGPSRMNRAVIIKTTWALLKYLDEHGLDGPIVVGFDARPTSFEFASDTVGVLAGGGRRVLFFDRPTPTPIIAFAAKTWQAAAAVVITASHNPPQDNGYKVYGPNASQIVSPIDEVIQINISTSPRAIDVLRLEHPFNDVSDLIELIGNDVLDKYWEQVSASRSRGPGSDLAVVYTPIHGVGYETLSWIMEKAGHWNLMPVAEQVVPDGTFPTVDFPNPEEPGALDLALALAAERDADLVIANDPDGDRLAAVVPTPNGWRTLSGNEIGVALGEYLLANHNETSKAIVASSIVSSPMMGLIASSHGAMFERTLTGFKWIVAAGLQLQAEGVGEFIFGYEEALGYTVGGTVRDKDGISAALLFTDLVADLHEAHSSIDEYLTDLWRRHGLWVSAQTSLTMAGDDGPDLMTAAVGQVADHPPDELDGLPVTGMTDFRLGADQRPVWLGAQDLVELELGPSGRVLLRPSGTEPKLKIYVDLSEPLDGKDVVTQRDRLQQRAQKVGNELGSLLAGTSD